MYLQCALLVNVSVVFSVDDVFLNCLDLTRARGLDAAGHRVAVLHHQEKLGEGHLAVLVHVHLFDQMLSRLDLGKEQINW